MDDIAAYGKWERTGGRGWIGGEYGVCTGARSEKEVFGLFWPAKEDLRRYFSNRRMRIYINTILFLKNCSDKDL